MIFSTKKTKVLPLKSQKSEDILTEICREGAREMLQKAIEREVGDYIERHKTVVNTDGLRLVVRNGFLPERSIQTGIGAISVRQPRVLDQRQDEDGEKIRFQSSILPPYLRRSKSMEEFIPWLYLRGISTGDFSETMVSILGKDAPGLSATTITRLKAGWLDEYKSWSKRSLKGKRYVYIWVDGIYSRIRLGEPGEKQCLLVVMGATADGQKELVAVEAGIRESELSWREILLNLKQRGLDSAP